jgi:hypothetical protein
MKTPFAVAAAMLVLLSGCSTPAGTTENEQTAAPGSSASMAEPASTPAGTSDSEFGVTIGGSHLTKDYKGKKTLVVDFTFKNNSDKATNFLVAVSAKAFQNGVELDTAIVGDDEKYDSGASMKDIKPGASIKTQEAYVLSDGSDVSVEVTTLFSLSDTPLATKTFTLK